MDQQKDTFLKRLSESGLVTDLQLAEARGHLANLTMDAFASDIVGRGVLTRFQLEELQAGRSKGLVLGQYRILEELGRGGYGCVYKARHNLMERVVALKVIAPELIENPQARTWFRREVLAATQLNHPNIVSAYDADDINGILFFAMEFVDGPNLDGLVRAQGPLPIGMACELMQQAAKALQYAHEKGMVHRDIKPANLLVPTAAIVEWTNGASPLFGAPRSVLVKVVDFGLARLQRSSQNNTLNLQNERSFVGTPAYVSPEQASNVHDADIRSDLYSLGCTFYFALTGAPPFRGQTALQTIVQHLEREADPIEQTRPEIPPALASIVRRLMAKKPEKRFQTPAELLSELSFFYGKEGKALDVAMPTNAWLARREPESAPPSDVEVHVSAKDDSEFQLLEVTRVKPDLQAPVKKAPSGTTLLPVFIPEAALPKVERTILYEPAPIQERPQPQFERVSSEDLQALWTEWTECIEAIRDSGRSPISEPAYQLLHRQLVAACEAHAPESATYVQMAEITRPWLSVQTLTGSDPQTIASLLTRCRHVSRSLGLSREGMSALSIAAFLLVALATAGAVWLASSTRWSLPATPNWLAALQRHPIIALAVVVPLVVGAILFMLKRFLRA